jgi:branched-chain amino acid transport system permease protein
MASTRRSRPRPSTLLKVALAVAALVFLMAVPQFASGYHVRFLTGLFVGIAVAQAWNMLGGLAGLLSLAPHMFFGLGALIVGYLLVHGVSSLPLAGLVSVPMLALLAVIVGYPLLRLRGYYFLIGSLVAAQAVSTFVFNITLLGVNGSLGFSLISVAPKLPIREYNAYFYYLMLIVAVAVCAAFLLVNHSRFGLALRSIRGNEVVAEQSGVPVTRMKVAAFALSGVITALVGAAWA